MTHANDAPAPSGAVSASVLHAAYLNAAGEAQEGLGNLDRVSVLVELTYHSISTLAKTAPTRPIGDVGDWRVLKALLELIASENDAAFERLERLDAAGKALADHEIAARRMAA